MGRDFVNGDDDSSDDHGHGTHVAGTIGAVANNGIGIAGVAPGSRILAIKVLDHAGYGMYSNIAAGILEANRRGAKVINLSLGGRYRSKTLELAIQEATRKGSLVVAAAGNSGDSAEHYPGAFDEAVGVGAIDQASRRASFSTFGSWVDVAAPGVGILSTTPTGYASWRGTSMATPHVAAVAALLLEADPKLTPAQMKQVLMATADPVKTTAANMQNQGIVNSYTAASQYVQIKETVKETVGDSLPGRYDLLRRNAPDA
jgi:thermitase